MARIERLEQADVDDIETLQELLYGLYALIDTHFRKEEDIQLPAFDATPDVTAAVLERMGALAGHPTSTKRLFARACARRREPRRGRASRVRVAVHPAGGRPRSCRMYAEKGDWKFERALPRGHGAIGSHDLRHSFVSRLISLGLDVVEVSRQARDTPQTILRVLPTLWATPSAAWTRPAIYEGRGSGLLQLWEMPSTLRSTEKRPLRGPLFVSIPMHAGLRGMGATGLEPVTPSLSSWCSPN